MTGAVSFRWRSFKLPMRHRFEAAHGALEDNPGVLIELTDAHGNCGVGEASPMPSLGAGTVDDVIALIEEHGTALLQGATLPDGPGVASLRCAIDVATLDLEGRAKGRSIASLLAEEPAEWVQSNAVIGGGPPTEVARFGREAELAGYTVLKVKVGVQSAEEDVRRISALREACTDAVIRLDANGAWDEDTANEAIHALYPLGIELIEQPTPATDVDMLARIHAEAPMRIAADESVFDPGALERILEVRATDLLVLKPMMLGGLRPALQVAQRAAETGIGAFVTTTFDSSIGTAASLQLAAALPADAAHGLATGELLGDDVTTRTLLPQDGRMLLPPEPGLGVAVDPEALERVATGSWVTVAG